MASATLIVRRASKDDAAAMAILHRTAFADGWSAPAFRKLIETPSSVGFVVEDLDADTLRALILIQIATDQSEILTIATAPSLRRQGLARTLLLAAGKEAAARGAAEMFLEVAESNDAARGLYQGLGFAASGTRRNYYRNRSGGSTDALIFRARLPLEA